VVVEPIKSGLDPNGIKSEENRQHDGGSQASDGGRKFECRNFKKLASGYLHTVSIVATDGRRCLLKRQNESDKSEESGP
jgi:hypothetical protein